ncbi:endonuclease/exonuclease/phosphatase family protein [Haladaptatus pallidirubidus]|uniref:Endonuclease/exonuclease/phosphatase family protein n=1 Tax=Haladaptatus pallidirubidus TaxID=1008152 RepID=A0AAV3UIK6_9EURY|nr:endonuclease/exonuclease/phosphatase family protein [Haladaptatus pallidirubidus]
MSKLLCNENTVANSDTTSIKRRAFIANTGATAVGLGAMNSASAAEANSNTSKSLEDDTDSSIKVLNWNIYHGTGMDDRYDLRRIADLIERSDADLVGIQEVDKHLAARSDCDDQPERLAELLNMHVDYAANITNYESSCTKQSRYGTAILTKRKYPILNSEHYLLPSPQVEDGAYNEPRGLQETTVKIHDDEVRFYTTHLDHMFKERRTAQVKAILDITGNVSQPRIITGDFNAVPNADSITTMIGEYTDVFTAIGNGDSNTYPAIYTDSTPEQRIDYVFISDDRISVTDAGIDEETLVSDHLPTFATLQLR